MTDQVCGCPRRGDQWKCRRQLPEPGLNDDHPVNRFRFHDRDHDPEGRACELALILWLTGSDHWPGDNRFPGDGRVGTPIPDLYPLHAMIPPMR